MNIDERNSSTARATLFIIALCILTRLPFRSRTLYHWDSVQFSLALHHFDVSLHQPHPPGYILYVAAGKVFNAFIHDENTALVTVSIVFTILSSLLLFYFLNFFVERRMAFLSALFYLSSPLVWFHGEVAFSYIAEGFFSTVVAYFCYHHVKTKNSSALALATFFLGISGGMRQNTMVLLIPLWLYSMLSVLATDKNRNVMKITKGILLQTAFLAAMTASWFIPMILLSGGYHEYNAALQRQWTFVFSGFSIFGRGWKAILHNGMYLFYYLFCAFTLAIFPVAVYLYFSFRNSQLKTRNSQFIFWWTAPPLLFYLTIHINNPGYIFTFVPAVFIILAKSVEALRQKAGMAAFNVIMAVFFATNIFFFFLPAAVQTSFPEIHSHDENLQALVYEIREKFQPNKTIILSFNHFYYGFRHAMVYLPEYTSYEVLPEACYDGRTRKFLGGDEYRFKRFDKISIPHRTKYVIIFSDPRLGYHFAEQTLKSNKTIYITLQDNFTLKHKTLPSGYDIYWFELK